MPDPIPAVTWPGLASLRTLHIVSAAVSDGRVVRVVDVHGDPAALILPAAVVRMLGLEPRLKELGLIA